MKKRVRSVAEDLTSEVLILSDGTILAHKLTPAMASLLARLNPDDTAMNLRAGACCPLPASDVIKPESLPES
jgi:hypothetical protein